MPLLDKISNVIIVPGNGCTPVKNCNWYMWLKTRLEKDFQVKVNMELHSMPDPIKAREEIWLPHIRNKLQCGENSVLIGHSSGAEAIMRFAFFFLNIHKSNLNRLCETDKVLGLVLVSACHTDLGMESEAISGYYNRPWKWNDIRKNCSFIIQFHCRDDPFIPIEEARHVATNLKSDYHELDGEGHFMDDDCHSVYTAIKEKFMSD
jgi:predicted alpha/beta hydrolase family esterase